ncbi:MAG: hypothetical protein HC929_25350 [Leptolyngbyaceae cyanobacterium SM2_5_2]|nr:hypothetical protein [Leptolyngbyaceae cyanobacterium SM2_5_2]
MPTDNPKICTYVTPDLKERLEKLAQDEQRTLSNLLAYLLTEALERRGR